ncbi:MAG: winged helix-turn-helix domain-containing protein [Deltaproteobacteria bacterium]|nr:winged helix-turn-helix domain-containing protein [Deltaproteobacteria bacterium]
MVCLGGLRFDRRSGELTDEAGHIQRLAPQPTALLALLVDRAGQVVTRDQIRAALWPDTTVDFAGSLHHCVRQVRVALSDRAKQSQFIETIPRRGYRLRAEQIGPDPGRPPDAPMPRGHRGEDAQPGDTEMPGDEERGHQPVALAAAPGDRRRPRAASEPNSVRSSVIAGGTDARSSRRTFVGLAAAIGMAGLAWSGVTSRPAAGGVRIAIMSFADTRPGLSNAERIGETVLIDLSRGRPDAAVVGPRTTEPLRTAGRSLREIATTLEVAYVLNAKPIDGPALLVELIRTDDGKHVWVQGYDDLADWRSIATEISDAAIDTVP